jgi:dihydrofolate reductase
MGKLVVVENLTLDGVMQGPARPEEDVRGGFQLGGWGIAFSNDAVIGKAMAERMARGRDGSGLLLGRWTYQNFFEVWPKRKDNPYTEVLNRTQKFVASNTLKEPLPWSNSTLVSGDIPTRVAQLKNDLNGDLGVLGSGELVRSLMPHGLIDEYVLTIAPVVLGKGRRLFPDPGTYSSLELVESRIRTSGAILAVYRPKSI